MKKFEKPDFLPMLKQLIMCYQGYEKLANQHFADTVRRIFYGI